MIEQEGIMIPSTTKDSLPVELDVSVDVVTMDVEGTERMCLPASCLRRAKEIACVVGVRQGERRVFS